MIPGRIDGKTVTTIGGHFFDSHNELTDVFLAPTITAIDAEATDSVIIHCDKDSKVMRDDEVISEVHTTEAVDDNEDADEESTSEEVEKENSVEEKHWNIEVFNDSDPINFLIDTNPFFYNEIGDEIEITGYSGNEKTIIIPSYINGKPVTDISMDLLGYDCVIIPETVTNITGKVAKVNYDVVFVIELIMTLIAVVIVMIVVNVAIPRLRKGVDEVLLTTPQIVLSILVVVIQAGFSIFAIYYGVTGPLGSVAISAVIICVYLVLVTVGSIGRNYEKEVEQHIEEKTSKMKEIKSLVIGLSNSIEDGEAKRQVDRLIEDIKYLPNASKDISADDAIASKIVELKELITSGEEMGITEKCNEISSLIKRR